MIDFEAQVVCRVEKLERDVMAARVRQRVWTLLAVLASFAAVSMGMRPEEEPLRRARVSAIEVVDRNGLTVMTIESGEGGEVLQKFFDANGKTSVVVGKTASGESILSLNAPGGEKGVEASSSRAASIVSVHCASLRTSTSIVEKGAQIRGSGFPKDVGTGLPPLYYQDSDRYGGLEVLGGKSSASVKVLASGLETARSEIEARCFDEPTNYTASWNARVATYGQNKHCVPSMSLSHTGGSTVWMSSDSDAYGVKGTGNILVRDKEHDAWFALSANSEQGAKVRLGDKKTRIWIDARPGQDAANFWLTDETGQMRYYLSAKEKLCQQGFVESDGQLGLMSGTFDKGSGYFVFKSGRPRLSLSASRKGDAGVVVVDTQGRRTFEANTMADGTFNFRRAKTAGEEIEEWVDLVGNVKDVVDLFQPASK